MIKKFLLSMAINFVIRQIEKFKDSLDWEKLKNDLDERTKSLVPGTWLDDDAVSFVNVAFDYIKSILGQGDHFKHILQLLADKDYSKAIAMLKDLILGHLSLMEISFGEHEKELKDLLVA